MTSIKIKFRESKISKKKGTCYIQLIHKRKMKTIATGIRMEKTEWDPFKEHVVTSKAGTQRLKELLLIQKCLDEVVITLKEIIINLMTSQTYVTADMIVQNYRELDCTRSFFTIMEERIEELKKNGQKRTATNYAGALRMFRRFRKDRDISPDEINGKLMKDLELYLKKKDNSLNTISYYMRILQAAYNYAVEKCWIKNNAYPFKKVFTGEEKTAKRAVDKNIVLKLERLNLERQPVLELTRDIFMFSLYTRGMAFIDIACLKKENLKGEILEYKRHKTGQLIQMRLPDCAIALIKKYSAIMGDTDYLFPLLYHPGRKKYSSYDSALRLYNRRLKSVSGMMRLTEPLTSYVSRHTWATLAKYQGVATIIISDAMGHTSEATTRIYLDRINNAVLDEANNAVVNLISR